MNYIQTEIDGVWLIEPKVFRDERGYFMEAFKEEEFKMHIGDVHFIQDNESKSSFGVLRGLHYQKVKLDNKGIDIQGKPGAQARAIFDGKVAAVFQLNGLFNILIRHGNYISVYCNLASASVKTGDTVTTRQALGQVFSDGADNGRTVLHFQLRKEKEKLNPEPWLNR